MQQKPGPQHAVRGESQLQQPEIDLYRRHHPNSHAVPHGWAELPFPNGFHRLLAQLKPLPAHRPKVLRRPVRPTSIAITTDPR